MSDVINLEQQLSDAKKLVERKTRALRLAKNADFRELILDGFCLHEAARLVQMSSDPALDERQRSDALSMAQASGHLRRYMSMIVQMATVAEREMTDLEGALEEARREEDEPAEGDNNDDQE
jgi:hypothetical protein